MDLEIHNYPSRLCCCVRYLWRREAEVGLCRKQVVPLSCWTDVKMVCMLLPLEDKEGTMGLEGPGCIRRDGTARGTVS